MSDGATLVRVIAIICARAGMARPAETALIPPLIFAYRKQFGLCLKAS